MTNHPLPSSRGFTLVELLVVVSIVVLLVAMLVPAMESAVDEARKAKCATNLHAFHLAIAAYAHDSQNQLMTTGRYSTEHPYPHAPFVYATTRPGHWSLEGMAPYLFNYAVGKVGDLWYCPSYAWDWYRPENDRYAAGTRNTKPSNYHQGWYVQIGYAYFARVEEWESKASDPEVVTGRGLGGARQILMADSIYRWKGNGGVWLYNHGRYLMTGLPEMTGTNRLFGDGGVTWRGITGAENKAMSNRSGAELPDYVAAEGAPAISSINYFFR